MTKIDCFFEQLNLFDMATPKMPDKYVGGGT